MWGYRGSKPVFCLQWHSLRSVSFSEAHWLFVLMCHYVPSLNTSLNLSFSVWTMHRADPTWFVNRSTARLVAGLHPVDEVWTRLLSKLYYDTSFYGPLDDRAW